MYYFQFHIGDYKAATTHLSNEEDLAYRRLLDMYYDTEMPIPLDTHWVARRMCVGIDVINTVLSDFFVKTDAGWVNKRCDEEIAAYHRKKDGGKKGAELRWNKSKENSVYSIPIAMSLDTDSTPNANPIATINHKPITNKKNSSSTDERFNEFWDAFAYKRGKGGAERIWKKINPDNDLAEQIIAGARRYAQIRGSNKQYWKQAQGWLNDKRWEDEDVSQPLGGQKLSKTEQYERMMGI